MAFSEKQSKQGTSVRAAQALWEMEVHPLLTKCTELKLIAFDANTHVTAINQHFLNFAYFAYFGEDILPLILNISKKIYFVA